jgi:hypothetical protein
VLTPALAARSARRAPGDSTGSFTGGSSCTEALHCCASSHCDNADDTCPGAGEGTEAQARAPSRPIPAWTKRYAYDVLQTAHIMGLGL